MIDNNKMPIVIATDGNLERQAIVLIYSLLMSAYFETEYHIIILVDESVNIEKIRNTFATYQNVSLEFHVIEGSLLKNVHLELQGITAFTYSRLYIPQIFQEYDRCLYLDVDILVNDDLSELLSWNMEDYYVAGVRDGLVQKIYQEKNISSDVIGGEESLKNYINAGVLLMNLKKMRDDGIDNQLVESIGLPLFYQDQDIVNKCCASNKYLLPIKYNFLAEDYDRKDAAKFGFYQQNDIDNMFGKPVILHYAGGGVCKPWNCTKGRAAKLWWNVAKKVLSGEDYDDLYAIATENEYKMSLKNMIDFCGSKQVVIWGYTKLAEKLCDVLLHLSVDIICFGDNDDAKQGLTYRDIPVKNIEEVNEYSNEDVCFVIVSQRAYLEIEQFLNGRGYRNTFHYKVKTKNYYIQLDEEFYEEEIEEIEWLEQTTRKQFDEQIVEKYCLYQWDLYNDGKTGKC